MHDRDATGPDPRCPAGDRASSAAEAPSPGLEPEVPYPLGNSVADAIRAAARRG